MFRLAGAPLPAFDFGIARGVKSVDFFGADFPMSAKPEADDPIFDPFLEGRIPFDFGTVFAPGSFLEPLSTNADPPPNLADGVDFDGGLVVRFLGSPKLELFPPPNPLLVVDELPPPLFSESLFKENVLFGLSVDDSVDFEPEPFAAKLLDEPVLVGSNVVDGFVAPGLNPIPLELELPLSGFSFCGLFLENDRIVESGVPPVEPLGSNPLDAG